jgi:hypothetical protein
MDSTAGGGMSDLRDIERYLKSIAASLKRIADKVDPEGATSPKVESAVSVEAVPKQLSPDDEATMRRSAGAPIDDKGLSDPAWLTERERDEARRLNGTGPMLSESSLKRFFR